MKLKERSVTENESSETHITKSGAAKAKSNVSRGYYRLTYPKKLEQRSLGLSVNFVDHA